MGGSLEFAGCQPNQSTGSVRDPAQKTSWRRRKIVNTNPWLPHECACIYDCAQALVQTHMHTQALVHTQTHTKKCLKAEGYKRCVCLFLCLLVFSACSKASVLGLWNQSSSLGCFLHWGSSLSQRGKIIAHPEMWTVRKHSLYFCKTI